MAMSRQSDGERTRRRARRCGSAQWRKSERGTDEEEARGGVGLHAPGNDGAGAHVLDDHEGAADQDRPAAHGGGDARAQPQRRAGDDERQAGVELHDEVAGERAIERRVVERPRGEDERADDADDDAADARRRTEARAQLRHVGHGNTVAASSVEDTMTGNDDEWGRHRDPRCDQALRRLRRRRRPDADGAARLGLRLHRAQRQRQDDDAAHDHEHPLARRRRDRRARRADDGTPRAIA